jgi:hypothetical protein
VYLLFLLFIKLTLDKFKYSNNNKPGVSLRCKRRPKMSEYDEDFGFEDDDQDDGDEY